MIALSLALAAARVITVAPHGELRGALIGAIAREQNPSAGAAMIRDLLILSGDADKEFIDVQVRRFGDEAVFVFAEWLAREHVDQFIERHDQFAAVGVLWRNAVARIASMAALQHRGDAERLRAAWPAGAAAGAADTTAAVASGMAPTVRASIFRR